MNKTYALFVAGCMGFMMLCSFVSAQSSPTSQKAPTVASTCPSCVSGSPYIASYNQMMGEIITLLNTIPSKDPGAIVGVENNMQSKVLQSNSWINSLKESTITINKQPAGLKSDLLLLNKTLSQLSQAGVIIINTKFQRTETIDSDIIKSLNSIVDKYVSGNAIFSQKGSISPTTYADLLYQLANLHQQVALIPFTQSRQYTISWMGYVISNKTVVTMIDYYSCAQSVPVCSNSSSLFDDLLLSIKNDGERLTRAMKQISSVTSRSFRTINGSLPLKDRFVLSVSTPFSSLKFKEQQDQKRQQNAEYLAIKEAQKTLASAQPTDVSILVRPLQYDPKNLYNRGDVRGISDAFNQTMSDSLSHYQTMVSYAVGNDARSLTYLVPNLLSQIDQSSNQIKETTNAVYDTCKAHCTNDVQINCGQPITS